jgi:hypothetical protein
MFYSIDEKHHDYEIMSMFRLTIKIETLYNEYSKKKHKNNPPLLVIFELFNS